MGWMVQGNWEKPPSDFDTTAWMLEHTALVNKERESLEGTGYVVHTENQNLFRLRGTTATIAGKPDPIGEKTNEILISDAKTGHRSPSHRAQVQIYQYAVPKALTQFQGKQARGQVRYPDSYVGSPATSVTPDFVANLGSLIRRLADDVPARRVPSAQECRYCDITRADCPDRMEDSGRIHGRLLARVGKAMPRVNSTAGLAGPTTAVRIVEDALTSADGENPMSPLPLAPFQRQVRIHLAPPRTICLADAAFSLSVFLPHDLDECHTRDSRKLHALYQMVNVNHQWFA